MLKTWREREETAAREHAEDPGPRPLSDAERKWIKILRRTMRAKPSTLWLLATDGALVVYPDEDGIAKYGHGVASVNDPKTNAMG